MDSPSKRHPDFHRSFSHKNAAASSSKSSLRRSHSVKNSSLPSSSSASSSLPRSSSLRAAPPSSSSKFSTDAHIQSEKGSGNIAKKYSSLAKEQKARFYIMRRCVAMLVCWHKHGD
ncbi:hypothetical protein MLD38_003575 [Melastoma candidum]|uniref:Uncharacterized protein n=1 Tax=Melastoma candidum TaxID=119954 RepID=A0ACB9S4D5_9MYRT|nr:hypothetical protein MLD38_003575 [Melastoma candidum]